MSRQLHDTAHLRGDPADAVAEAVIPRMLLVVAALFIGVWLILTILLAYVMVL